MSRHFRALLLALTAISMLACTQTGDEGVIVEQTDVGVTGTYGDISFSSSMYGDTHEVVVELNGLTLMALNSPTQGAIQLDGFASDNGQDSQMLADDRALLADFRAALDELGTRVSPAVAQLRRAVGLWEQWPDSMSLQREVLASAKRSASMCSQVNSYVTGTHDCDFEDRNHDYTTVNNVYISMHSGGSCNDGTYFYAPFSGQYYVYPGVLGGYWSELEYKSQGWNCFEPDHDYDIEYAYGNCFGRCGGGCGSDTQFTRDCLDHDTCVRFGHAVGSGWCSDELAGAAWDELNAGNCF